MVNWTLDEEKPAGLPQYEPTASGPPYPMIVLRRFAMSWIASSQLAST